MAAFERIKSGIGELDETLDNIRLGDNVVWQVSNLKEFSYFVNPYVKQALKDKRNLIYINFGQHEPLIDMDDGDFEKLEAERNNPDTEFAMIEKDGIKIYKVDPMEQFESFTLRFTTSSQKRALMRFMSLTAFPTCRLHGLPT